MTRDLLYAAIKAIKIPDTLKLKSGRYTVDETLHLQGDIIVGLPTYYQKTPVNIDTLTRLCGVLNCSQDRAIKLFNQICSMSQEDIDRAQEKYGASLKVTEQIIRESLPKKERKGSISGNITIR
jgi:hypothetical protein